MVDSILNGTKKALGIGAEYDAFDPEITMHINSVFSTLQQLGIGPVEGFMIEDATETWDTFLLGDNRLNAVKSYMFDRVKLIFDPPANSFLVAAIEKRITEQEWRLNVAREVARAGNVDENSDLILDGGAP